MSEGRGMSDGQVPDAVLMAFADGELEPHEARALAQRVAREPLLAERVAWLRRSREAARLAFADVAREPVPSRLVEAILAADRSEATPVAAPRPAWSRARLRTGLLAGVAGALAGALAVGLAGFGGGPSGGMGPLAGYEVPLGRALASGATGSSVQDGAARVRIAGSYAVEGGGVCRSFVAEGGARPVTGLACRESDAWSTRLVVASPVAGGGFRPASAEEPLVRELLDRLGAAEPMDAATERRILGLN